MAANEVAHSDNDMKKPKSSDSSEESLELDSTTLNLWTGIDQKAKKLDSSLGNAIHHDVEPTKIKDISCTLSPIKTDEDGVIVVTPVNQNWIGQTQSTPKDSGVSSRRGLVYKQCTDQENGGDDAVHLDDHFITLSEVYDDDMTYDQLLAEVSRLSNVSVQNQTQKLKTTVSKIDLKDIIPAHKNLDLSIGDLNTSGDIHDGKYFASKCNPELSVGRFTGIQSSRHVFDETTLVEEPQPSADILGLEQYLCSDSEDNDTDDADKTKTNLRDTGLSENKVFSLKNDFHSFRRDEARKSYNNDKADKTTIKETDYPQNRDYHYNEIEPSPLLKDTKTNEIGSCSKEPGELSPTTASETTDTEPETEVCSVKRARAEISRKRKLHRERSDKEEGELSTTTDDTDTDTDRRTSDNRRETRTTENNGDTKATKLLEDASSTELCRDSLSTVLHRVAQGVASHWDSRETELQNESEATKLHRDSKATKSHSGLKETGLKRRNGVVMLDRESGASDLHGDSEAVASLKDLRTTKFNRVAREVVSHRDSRVVASHRDSKATELHRDSKATELHRESKASEATKLNPDSRAVPSQRGFRATELHRDSRATELHRDSKATELHRDSRATELHTDSRETGLHRDFRATELHRESIATEATKLNSDSRAVASHRGNRATKLHRDSKATEFHRDSRATELQREARSTLKGTDTKIPIKDRDSGSNTDTETSGTDTETTVTTDTDDSEQYTWVEKTIDYTWAEKTLLPDPGNRTKSLIGSCETVCSGDEVYGPVALPKPSTQAKSHEIQKKTPSKDFVIVIDDSESSFDRNEVVKSSPCSLSAGRRYSRTPAKKEKNQKSRHPSNFKSNQSVQSEHCGSFVLLSEDLANSLRTKKEVKAISPEVEHKNSTNPDFTEDSFDLIESGAFAESFIVIDSPQKVANGSFLVIDEVSSDEILIEEVVNACRQPTSDFTICRERSGICKEKSNVEILKPGRFNQIKDESFKKDKQKCDAISDLKKITKTKISPVRAPFKEHVVEKSIRQPSKKKTSIKGVSTESLFKKAIGQIVEKENKPAKTAYVTLDKKVMDIGFETDLMRLVKQKWKVAGIQRQDDNLTFSSRARRNRRHPGKLYLEGSDRTPPLFRDNSELTAKCESSECESPKMKKRKTDISPVPSSTNRLLSDLQAELAAIEAEHVKTASMLQNQHRQRMNMLQKHHNTCIQNLRTKQNLERRQFYHTYHGHLAMPYLQQQMILFKHDHHNQIVELTAVTGMEVNNLLAVLEGEKQAQNMRFEMMKEPKRQMIRNVTEQSKAAEEALKAQMAQMGNPHETVQLWKAPCKSNHGQKSLVEVCLPTEIASYMMREDELYDAHYQYE